MSLLDQAADHDSLKRAFAQVCPKPSSGSSYRREYEECNKNSDAIIQDISCKLKDGSFTFGSPKLVILDKKRPILTIGVVDRTVEKSLLNVLSSEVTDKLAFPSTYARKRQPGENPRSFRFLCSEVQAFREEFPYVFETDIQKFFPSIVHDHLRRRLKELMGDRSVDWILELVANRRPIEGSYSSEYKVYFGDELKNIPQGSCLSPLLAAIYLRPFDQAMVDAGIRYIRYVDDLLVFANSNEQAQSHEKIVHEELGNLSLNADRSWVAEEEKACIKASSEELNFLGFAFGKDGKVYPQRKAVDRFKSHLEEIQEECSSLKDLLTRTNNFVMGWQAAYDHCTIPRRLKKYLDNAVQKMVFEWLNKAGIDAGPVRKLPPARRAALFGITQLHSRSVVGTPCDFIEVEDDSAWYEESQTP